MPKEIIGKCKCIYPFEKSYIIKSLDELIKRTDERIKILEAKDTDQEILMVYDNVRNNIKIVKERTEATKECEVSSAYYLLPDAIKYDDSSTFKRRAKWRERLVRLKDNFVGHLSITENRKVLSTDH